MHEPPARSPLRTHLSTAIVLMFAVGVLLWANLRPRFDTVLEPVYLDYGFPCDAYHQVRGHGSWDTALVVVNVMLGLVILLGVWGVCETWARRKKPTA